MHSACGILCTVCVYTYLKSHRYKWSYKVFKIYFQEIFSPYFTEKVHTYVRRNNSQLLFCIYLYFWIIIVLLLKLKIVRLTVKCMEYQMGFSRPQENTSCGLQLWSTDRIFLFPCFGAFCFQFQSGFGPTVEWKFSYYFKYPTCKDILQIPVRNLLASAVLAVS